MKQVLMATALTLACVAALAQTPSMPPPAGKTPESGAVPIGPKAAAAAEAKVDARQAASPGQGPTMANKVPESGAVPPNAKAAGKAEMNVKSRDIMVMDTNGDGMISRKEYDAYHSGMWKKMNAKNGRVAQADMDSMLKQGGAR